MRREEKEMENIEELKHALAIAEAKLESTRAALNAIQDACEVVRQQYEDALHEANCARQDVIDAMEG